jgi:hypothetical protein
VAGFFSVLVLSLAAPGSRADRMGLPHPKPGVAAMDPPGDGKTAGDFSRIGPVTLSTAARIVLTNGG